MKNKTKLSRVIRLKKNKKFHKKYIIIGTILFSDNSAEIIDIIKEEMIYSQKKLNKILSENDSKDYIILPEYTNCIISSKLSVIQRLVILKRMSYDIGWIDQFKMIL